MSTKRLTIFDTTLRDGEQAPGFSLRIDEKLTMARQLAALGRGRDRGRVPDRLGGRCRIGAAGGDATMRGPIIAGAGALHARPTSTAPAGRSSRPSGAASTSSSRPRTSTSRRKLRISREACLDAAVAAVHRARRYTDDVQFSAEDATRSDLDFLCRVVEEVISAGCTTVNLPDTVGYSTPDEIGAFFRDHPRARARTRATPPSARTATTTSGLAVANTLAAVRPARARWSARSTASASGPATPRSKRS